MRYIAVQQTIKRIWIQQTQRFFQVTLRHIRGLLLLIKQHWKLVIDCINAKNLFGSSNSGLFLLILLFINFSFRIAFIQYFDSRLGTFALTSSRGIKEFRPIHHPITPHTAHTTSSRHEYKKHNHNHKKYKWKYPPIWMPMCLVPPRPWWILWRGLVRGEHDWNTR